MSTKRAALELADWLTEIANTAPVTTAKKQISRASDAIRRQHARIEALERALADLMPTFDHLERTGVRVDPMQVAAARALLTKE